MPSRINHEVVNPVAEMFAIVADEFLRQNEGKIVDSRMREELGNLMMETTRDFVGITESAEILGVSKQRVNQLIDKSMPVIAGRINAGPFWLKEQIVKFHSDRKSLVSKHMGIPTHLRR